MKESARDIKHYLNIIDGAFDKKINNEDVDLGIHTSGASIGKMYIFENGLRWAKIIDEHEDHWLIDHGLIEYDTEETIYLSKYDMSDMIRNGEMMIIENLSSPTKILLESTDDHGFRMFMEKVESYLYKNTDMLLEELNHDWKSSYIDGLTPIEAAEEALFSEK